MLIEGLRGPIRAKIGDPAIMDTGGSKVIVAVVEGLAAYLLPGLYDPCALLRQCRRYYHGRRE